MILQKGDMFEAIVPAGTMYIATGNNVIKENGELVMGKGNALEAKQRFPYVPREFADIIKLMPTKPNYFFIPHVSGFINDSGNCILRWVGLFQSKFHYRDKSDLNLISTSCTCLNNFSRFVRPDLLYILPFPGINNGGLQNEREKILEMLKTLPDNVEVWEL